MAQFTDRIQPKDFAKMPDEYRDLLVRLLTIQADCEIGGPHIYVDHWTLRAPTVDDRDTWQTTMCHIALEGRCFVFSAVQYLTRADCPADYHPMQGDAPDTVLIRGGSAIYGPLGEEIAAPARHGAEGGHRRCAPASGQSRD